MDSKLARYFRRQRIARKLKPSQLARLAGYRNVNRFCRRLQQFETKGWVHPEMLPPIAAALSIGPAIFLRLMQQDWLTFIDQWFVKATTPIRPVLVFPLFMAADRIRLPCTIQTLEQAETFASAMSGERCHWARLILSRRFYAEYGRDGEVTGYYEKRPADWIWQPEPTEARQVTRHRVALLFSWPDNPVEDEL